MLYKLIAENLYKWEKYASAPPTQISITPTNLCNLKCHSCWQRDEIYYPGSYNKKPAEIPEEKLCQIIREAGELGVRSIELTGGGEPLARKDTTLRLIKEIKNKGMIGWMTSNGTLFSPDIIKLMVELEWDKLTISLDGPDAQINDFLRPPAGTFDRVINTLSLFNEYKKLLQKELPEITFNVVVSKYNINRLSEIISLAGEHSVRGVTFEPVKILSGECKGLLVDFEKEYGRVMEELEKTQTAASKNNIFTNIDGLMLTPELIKYSGKLLNNMPTEKIDSRESKLLEVSCIEPWFHIYLDAEGNVRPCCVSVGFGENIHNKSLKNIWFGEKFISFRDAIIRKDYPLSCNQCNANLICYSRVTQKFLKDNFLSSSQQPAVKKQTDSLQKQRPIKMLITDTAPLYPPRWGGPRRIWNLYSNLSQELFDITYVGVNCGVAKELQYSFNKICNNFKEILCVFPAHYYFWHAFEKLIFKNIALDFFVYLKMHTDWQFKYILNSRQADVIVCSHPWSARCIKKESGQLFIYDAHNCEYLLMDRILKDHIFKRPILKQVRQIEGNACKKSDLILACSENEKKDLMDLYSIEADRIIVVPNGTDIIENKNEIAKKDYRTKLSLSDEDKVMVFVGSYYKPNIDAARFILEDLSRQLKEFKFLIAGSIIDGFKSEEIPFNVKFLGWIPDEQLDAVLRACDIAINPMFDGSGINIKMLDYMSRGLPVVTSECGARGIELFGKRPMIVSSFDAFADNIRKLLEDKTAYSSLSSDGRQLVSRHYDWKKISATLQDTILKMIDG